MITGIVSNVLLEMTIRYNYNSLFLYMNNQKMKIDLNQMLIFAKVVENQSFTKAAAELNIEKSTVSIKVSQLESHLGVRLLNRTTRSVTLTEAGEGYYRYCQQIVESALEAEQFAATLGDEPLGLLRVSASNDFGQLFIQKLIGPFMKSNPKVEIELILEYRFVDLVKERVDIALRLGRGLLDDSSLIAKKIATNEIGLFASPGFIMQYGKLEQVEQMSQFDFIEFTLGETSILPIKKGGATYQYELKGRFKVNDVLAAKEAAKFGLGIVALPKIIATEEVNNKQLVPLLSDCEFLSLSLYAVYPSRQWMPAKLKAFLEYLDHFERYFPGI